jgi:hypothetical protein
MLFIVIAHYSDGDVRQPRDIMPEMVNEWFSWGQSA